MGTNKIKIIKRRIYISNTIQHCKGRHGWCSVVLIAKVYDVIFHSLHLSYSSQVAFPNKEYIIVPYVKIGSN